MKGKNYDQTLKGIEELIAQYRDKPVTKKVEERKKGRIQDYLKKGMLAIPDETQSQESERRLMHYREELESITYKLTRLLECDKFVRIDEESLDMIYQTARATHSLGGEIRNCVEQKKVPEGYGLEVQYLETAKKAYETSKELLDIFRKIKPYEGKKVLLSEGKPITLKGILKEGWKEFKNRL